MYIATPLWEGEGRNKGRGEEGERGDKEQQWAQYSVLIISQVHTHNSLM